MDTIFTLSVSIEILSFLIFISIVAGVIDAIAGGGGLLTVPALMISGVPPLTALGTNRLQAIIGEFTACIVFIRGKQLKLQDLYYPVAFTAIGAFAGSVLVSQINKESIEIIIPVLMVAITLYSIFSKNLASSNNREAVFTKSQFSVVCGLLIGFYNGFFGPGTGSIWMVSFVLLLGYNIKQATIETKPLNLVGNLISMLLFIAIGQIDYTLGLLMGLGQILGSVIGGQLVLMKGVGLVRPVFITVSTLMTSKLLFESALL